VASAQAFCRAAEVELEKLQIAKLCRQAEHRFAGVRCGIMDQNVSLFAEERRCPLCGAYMNAERREVERRLRIRRQNPPTDPGPPAETDERRVERRASGVGPTAAHGLRQVAALRIAGMEGLTTAPRRRLTVRLAVLGLGLIGSVAPRPDASVSIATWSRPGAVRRPHEAGVVDLVADTVEGPSAVPT
jgi:hypothetical protein